MKWSSQPGANTGTNASSTVAPERSIAALEGVELAVDRIGPLRFERTAGDDAFSHRWHRRFAGDQKQRPSPVAIAIKIRKFVALAGRVPGRRRLVRRHRARLDTGEVGGVMGEIARRPEFAVADAIWLR
jgi:hypothetical protein